MPFRDWVWLVPALVVLAFVGFGVSMAVEPAVIDALFGWLPEWFVRPVDVDRLADFSREAWLVTLAAYLVLNGFIGPIVEEALLPRLLVAPDGVDGTLGPARPTLSLFSLYHFWSPWQIVGRILGFGPTVYAVRWKENVYLGMVVHCTLNTLGVSLVAGLILGAELALAGVDVVVFERRESNSSPFTRRRSSPAHDRAARPARRRRAVHSPGTTLPGRQALATNHLGRHRLPDRTPYALALWQSEYRTDPRRLGRRARGAGPARPRGRDFTRTTRASTSTWPTARRLRANT